MTLKETLLLKKIADMYKYYLLWKQDNNKDHLFLIYIESKFILKTLGNELMNVHQNFYAVFAGCQQTIEPYIEEFKVKEKLTKI